MEESDTSKAFIRTPVVIITGATSAGKTSVSNLLKETSNNPHYLVISQDDYFKDVHEVPFNPNGHQMWDDPVSIHWNKLLDHLKLLSFNPSHHCGSCNSQHLAAVGNDNALIKGAEPVAAVCHVIIVEGNMLIASRELMELSSMSFFIKLDYETCKQRRFDRKYFPSDTDHFFNEHVWPMYVKYESLIPSIPSITVLNGQNSIKELTEAIETAISSGVL